MLEHHVLRRMDDRERCVMSKMKPARGTTTGNDGCGTRTDRYFLKKHEFSFGRDQILLQNFNNRINSIVENQELNLKAKD